MGKLYKNVHWKQKVSQSKSRLVALSHWVKLVTVSQATSYPLYLQLVPWLICYHISKLKWQMTNLPSVLVTLCHLTNQIHQETKNDQAEWPGPTTS